MAKIVHWTAQNLDEARRLYEDQQLSCRQIADEMGFSASFLRRRLHDAGVVPRPLGDSQRARYAGLNRQERLARTQQARESRKQTCARMSFEERQKLVERAVATRKVALAKMTAAERLALLDKAFAAQKTMRAAAKLSEGAPAGG